MNLLEQLVQSLQQQDKAGAVRLCMDALDSGELTIQLLYEQVLAPALNNITVTDENEGEMIWREHMMSSIVRTIVEASYPYVLKERDKKDMGTDKRVIVFCPQQEEHEIGARMAADFFTIWGYIVIFIGANTPEKTLIDAVARLKPYCLCVSISNDYNLIAARDTIRRVRALDGEITIAAGGHAVASHPERLEQIGADVLLHGFDDIGRLRTGQGGAGV